VIREVQSQFSYGYLIYSNPAVQPGDQLREIPRLGVDASPYYHVITDGIEVSGVLGLRASASRGFFDLRPQAALEIPFRGLIADTLLPLNVLVGGEWNHYLGRIRLTPSAAIGIGGAVPLSDDPAYESFYLSHLGFQARIEGSILVARDWYLNMEVGVGYWAGIYRGGGSIADALASYGGLIIGGGVTIK
jgi:hypothetical protein